jgi:formylglycine-generating enzyme required for sulfatase activity
LVLAALAALIALGAGVGYGRWCVVRGSGPLKPAVTNSLGMQVAWVPSGEFTMGSAPDEPGHREDEGPAHRVVLSAPFYMAAHETTVAQFRAFVDETRYRTEAERDPGGGAQRWDEAKKGWEVDRTCTWRNPGWAQADDEPVVCVSRFDALAFCYWLSRREGRGYRLPTEAEWEYACRAGTTGAFPSGRDLAAGQANFAPAGPGRPTGAGSFPANAWGLSDLSGNVLEWCADAFDPTYYRDSPGRDPRGPDQRGVGVVRGGSWHGRAEDCRCAARLGVPVGSRRTDVGFRVVLEAGVR